jgi:hypothetical protein
MMPNEKTSPFWVPLGKEFGLRNSSGALHKSRLLSHVVFVRASGLEAAIEQKYISFNYYKFLIN